MRELEIGCECRVSVVSLGRGVPAGHCASRPATTVVREKEAPFCIFTLVKRIFTASPRVATFFVVPKRTRVYCVCNNVTQWWPCHSRAPFQKPFCSSKLDRLIGLSVVDSSACAKTRHNPYQRCSRYMMAVSKQLVLQEQARQVVVAVRVLLGDVLSPVFVSVVNG